MTEDDQLVIALIFVFFTFGWIWWNVVGYLPRPDDDK